MDVQREELRRQVEDAVNSTPVVDMHTHLYPANFGPLCLWGIDEVVTYHYLIAELFRSAPLKPAQFWALSKSEQADLIWETLFVRHTPVSEACRGVTSVMSAFGLDPSARDLREARAFFAKQDAAEHIDRVMDLAGVSALVMTNDPFNELEARLWRETTPSNKRFHAALRLDPILNDWPVTYAKLQVVGYDTGAEVNEQTAGEVRRFLSNWISRMRPVYMAVSLPPTFVYPDDSPRSRLLRDVIFPTCCEHNLPFAMMIGVKKRVNPALGDAGDSVGHADIDTVERICLENPDNKFLVTMLSRENQHELCVAARKFGNLMPFGCWWFLNNPSIVAEMTAERIELLGTSFIPQHSDARILEQLIYKWRHSRRVIAEALADSYAALARDGRMVTADEIGRDVARLFSGNFSEVAGLSAKYTVSEVR